MKPKISQVVKQVVIDFWPTESWLRTRKKVKESKCENCGVLHLEAKGEIALATIEGRVNAHICEKCGKDFIKHGAEDIKKAQDTQNKIKEVLITKILKWNTSYKRRGAHFSSYNLENKSLKDLQQIHDNEKSIIDDIAMIEQKAKDEYIATPTEQYLIDQYDIYEDDSLKHHLQIENYFKDCGTELFETGQGFYEDEVEVLVKIGNKFYDVIVYANIESSKQDHGDRLYWVENISDVSYIGTSKPKEKAKTYTDTELMDWLETYLPELTNFINDNETLREFAARNLKNIDTAALEVLNMTENEK